MGHFITGVPTEILTPFREDGSIDYKQVEELIEWQMAQGIENFFINGLAAECQALRVEEKNEIVENNLWCDTGKSEDHGLCI